MIKKLFNASCNRIVLHFYAEIMEFLIILKCLVSFLLITLQEEFPAIFIHFVKFAAEQVLKSFLAEIIP